MIIDFHTHTFPDEMAEKVIRGLSARGGMPYYSDATAGALRASMRRAGISYSVVLPVATAPRQVPTINRVSAENNGKNGLIYFGAIHPDCENIEEILDGIAAAGLDGIKLHPDYQQTYIDDDRYARIVREACKRRLVVVTHAGFDPAYADETHCTPRRILKLLEKLGDCPELRFVAAHLGSLDYADEVLRSLIGAPVYFDTAVVLDRYPEKCRKLIEAQGADRVLFASDSPWAPQDKFVSLLRSFCFSKEEEEKIFFGNADRLLGGKTSNGVYQPLKENI